MKKIISILLVAAMMSSFMTLGAAAANAENIENIPLRTDAENLIANEFGSVNVHPPLIQQVTHDLELLEQAHLNNLVEISEVDSSGNVLYEITFDEAGLVNYIDVETDSSGNVILNVTEGDKHNELIYMNDGRIFIDGSEVPMDDISPSTESSGVAPLRAGAYTKISGISLPNGVNSINKNVYSYTGRNYQGPTVSLGKPLRSLAVSVIIALIASKFSAPLATALSTLTQSLASSVLTDGLNFSKNNIALMASAYAPKDSVGIKVYEYANKKNDSLYSSWVYSIEVIPKTGPGEKSTSYYFGAQKVTQAT